MRIFGPWPSIFLNVWCWQLDTTLRRKCPGLEHNNFFLVLHETHLQVCVSQHGICLLFCWQTIPNIQRVAGSLKPVGPFLHSLHCLAGQSSWGPQVGCVFGDFCIWHFPLKWFFFYWHLFDFWPYLRGFQNQFRFKPRLPVGNGIDDLWVRW